MTAPRSGHERFGPYCGCRYVGRAESQGDVEVWLLYAGEPHAEDAPLVGVLYNRITARGTGRNDHWIARPHRRDHQGDVNAIEGPDEDEAAWRLWERLTGNTTAARAVQALPANCAGGCGPATPAGNA